METIPEPHCSPEGENDDLDWEMHREDGEAECT